MGEGFFFGLAEGENSVTNNDVVDTLYEIVGLYARRDSLLPASKWLFSPLFFSIGVLNR